MLELLSRAYTTISPDDTAACLGLQRDQAIQRAPRLPLRSRMRLTLRNWRL